jgi:Predicted metal-binding protein (DUF2103)
MSQIQAAQATPSTARLVMNHSTHLPGLIAVLEKLSRHDGINTITPGVICPVRAHVPQMRLRISVPIRGGFKIIARAGKIAQGRTRRHHCSIAESLKPFKNQS